MDRSAEDVVRRVLDRHGRTFAEDSFFFEGDLSAIRAGTAVNRIRRTGHVEV
jgi:hypothetical protein